MIIKVTETYIEADARELRESNTVADNFNKMLSRIFQPRTELFDTKDNEDGENDALD